MHYRGRILSLADVFSRTRLVYYQIESNMSYMQRKMFVLFHPIGWWFHSIYHTMISCLGYILLTYYPTETVVLWVTYNIQVNIIWDHGFNYLIIERKKKSLFAPSITHSSTDHTIPLSGCLALSLRSPDTSQLYQFR